MAKIKTQQNNRSVSEFLDAIPDENKKQDSLRIVELMKAITGQEPRMWGDSIIGFGEYHYKYESGRTGNWFLAGFSPRKQNLTLYIMSGFEEHKTLLQKLGKYKTAKSCLYINKLEEVDIAILQELVANSVKRMSGSRN